MKHQLYSNNRNHLYHHVQDNQQQQRDSKDNALQPFQCYQHSFFLIYNRGHLRMSQDQFKSILLQTKPQLQQQYFQPSRPQHLFQSMQASSQNFESSINQPKYQFTSVNQTKNQQLPQSHQDISYRPQCFDYNTATYNSSKYRSTNDNLSVLCEFQKSVKPLSAQLQNGLRNSQSSVDKNEMKLISKFSRHYQTMSSERPQNMAQESAKQDTFGSMRDQKNVTGILQNASKQIQLINQSTSQSQIPNQINRNTSINQSLSGKNTNPLLGRTQKNNHVEVSLKPKEFLFKTIDEHQSTNSSINSQFRQADTNQQKAEQFNHKYNTQSRTTVDLAQYKQCLNKKIMILFYLILIIIITHR